MSISRLVLEFAKGALPSLIHVGGRYWEGSLVSASGRIYLPEKFSVEHAVQSNDFLTVTFEVGCLRQGSTASEFILDEIRGVTRDLSPVNKKYSHPWPMARPWSDFVNEVRGFFRQRGLLEVHTPSLVVNPGMEPELEPFATEWKVGRVSRKLFLPTSPELHMKRLLVDGFSDIFEIKSVFRNEELTALHEPEFFMIEWYRSFAGLELIAEDLQALLQVIFGEPITVKKYSVAHFFFEFLGRELQPSTGAEDLRKWAEELGLKPSPDLDENDLFHLIWVAKIEPQLPLEPFLLVDYPPAQAALARINSRGWADRMEFFWQRIEIANAFNELNDPVEQRRRFEADRERRLAYGRTPLQIDEEFMKALEKGLPPCSGIALGLDRLFMIRFGLKDIKEARAFSYRASFENVSS